MGIQIYYLSIFIIFAGIPPTKQSAGTSQLTTEFAATIALAPIVTP